MTAITLNLDAVVRLSDEQFYELCQANPELQLERTATGELIAMSPTGGETGRTNATLNKKCRNTSIMAVDWVG